jgi:ribonuclease HII
MEIDRTNNEVISLLPFYNKEVLEAGCDEAGRGCLAGPVFAAAVILDPKNPIAKLNDSKQINKKNREILEIEIKEKALAWAIGMMDNYEIDKVNILKASFFSMHRALDQLKIKPQHLLIDGNRFIAYQDIPHTCIIKGDAKYQSIAAASILAKTARDHFMNEIDAKHPYYNWKKNMGYPTKDHRKAIAEHGATDYHRMTFQLLPRQLRIFE